MPASPPPSELFADGPGMLAALNLAGTLGFVNPELAAALGASPADLAGRKLADLAEPADRAAVAEALASARPQGAHRFAGGRTLAWRATRTNDDDALLLAAWDVTDLRAEVDALAAELDALISSVGHDLRAPLRAVDGFAGVLLRDAQTQALPDETRRFLGVLRDANSELTARFDALLEIARAARDPLHAREGVDVGALAREVIDYVLTPQAGDRDVTWVVADDLPPARADPALLRRLLVALLDNALRHSDLRVHVTLTHDAGAYVIRDDGPGPDPALVDKARTAYGPGVGLPVAARIAARHGGRLWAQDGALRFTLNA